MRKMWREGGKNEPLLFWGGVVVVVKKMDLPQGCLVLPHCSVRREDEGGREGGREGPKPHSPLLRKKEGRPSARLTGASPPLRSKRRRGREGGREGGKFTHLF